MGPGTWPPRTTFKTTFKMVHSEGCLIHSIPLEIETGKKCIATWQQHVNMFIARNSYEVAILAYFERGGLEKQRGGPPHSSYNKGNTGLGGAHTYLVF